MAFSLNYIILFTALVKILCKRHDSVLDALNSLFKMTELVVLRSWILKNFANFSFEFRKASFCILNLR